MIIDFITSCASIIKVSDYTNASNNMLSNNYSIKTTEDIQAFNLFDSPVSALTFTFISSEVKNLKEIDLDFTGEVTDVKIEISIDYINWYELDYKNDDKYLYKKIGDQYINLSTFEPMVGVVPYTFTQLNTFSNTVSYIYNLLEWKILRITFNGISNTAYNPLTISTLQILIDDNISTEIDSLLEVKSPMFTKSKIFEEDENYTFIPDMFTNYLKMLEDNNTEPDTINYVNVNLNLSPSVSANSDLNTVVQ